MNLVETPCVVFNQAAELLSRGNSVFYQKIPPLSSQRSKTQNIQKMYCVRYSLSYYAKISRIVSISTDK